MFTLRQYLLTLWQPHGLMRTLDTLEPLRDRTGRPLFAAGNSAAVFRVKYRGRDCALRCWFRPRSTERLRALYGDRLRERELFVYHTAERGEWVDAALCDWIEGPTLHRAACDAARQRDTERLHGLSRAFDAWAARAVADEEAWGDLKPENLIVDGSGAIRPIDFDARFLPAFAGERSPELGTAAYQHPARTIDDFGPELDDYPAAAISTALAALALDPSSIDRYAASDGLLLTPALGTADPARREALALFERLGDAAHYRIARLLASPGLRLPDLPTLLRCAVAPPAPADEAPELFARDGLWGYRRGAETAIDPLYDCAFDFTEGLAAVRLGAAWHYIDTAGRTRLHCPGCEAVKPFRGGRAEVRRDGRCLAIDREGNISE